MNKDKHPPHGPQLFPPSLKDLRRSPIWRQQQEVIAKLRERLPRYKLEELERLRAMLGAPHLPDVSLPPELEAQLREWRYRQSEPEQASEQAIEQPAEQPPEQPVNPVLEPIEQVFEQTIEQPIGQAPPANQAQTVEQVSTWIEQVLEQIEQAAEQPPEQASEQMIERAAQAPSRPRHRPPIEFPHLSEALAALGKEPRWKSMQPKEEIAFVMAFLRKHGNEVKDSHEKTIGRRIDRWRAARTKQKR
jgi:hypothetical protein